MRKVSLVLLGAAFGASLVTFSGVPGAGIGRGQVTVVVGPAGPCV